MNVEQGHIFVKGNFLFKTTRAHGPEIEHAGGTDDYEIVLNAVTVDAGDGAFVATKTVIYCIAFQIEHYD